MNKSLGQFFTQAWAAEQLFDIHFGHLTAQDVVWEPTCGEGAMLAAIPSHIRCVGTEIDPVVAQEARRVTGRSVITGSCLTVSLPTITAVYGNPPFRLTLFIKLLERLTSLFVIGNKAGFIIPAYFVQTSRTLMDFGRSWSIEQKIIPRDLFYGLSKPLVFGSFIRDNRPHLIGFELFPELVAIKELSETVQKSLATNISGPRSVWRQTVKKVLEELGGTAPLSDIYKRMEGRRPTDNQYWKEKVRQVCQQSFERIEEGVYSLKQAA